MNPAETYARLKLLELAIKRALPEAGAAAEAYRESVRARTLETDHGTVTGVHPKPAISVDDAGLLAWVQENRPDEIVPTVRSSFKAAWTKSLSVVDGEIVTADGEVVDFATLVQRRPYLTVRLTEDAQRAAEAAITGQVEAWSLPGVTHE